MKFDIVIIGLMIIALGISSASARVQQGNLADINAVNVPVISEGVAHGDSMPIGSDAINGHDQHVVEVKFELRRAPQVIMSSDLYDQIAGAHGSFDSGAAFPLRHRAFTYFAQPDRWYVLSLVLLLLLVQIRALPVTRSPIREMTARASVEPARLQAQSVPMMEAFE